MRAARLKTYLLMSGKELLRNRLALLLLFIIPSLFYFLTRLTIPDREIAFKLAAVSEGTVIHVSERSEALIFIGLAAVGVISSFLGLILSQKDAAATQRLILCGYRPSEIVISKLLLLAAVVLLVGCYVGFLLRFFMKPDDILKTMISFMLGGYVYGCYGILVGTIVRHELEGILLVVLLANIDIGWLQNPIYYADAQNKLVIRLLPAFYPSQTSMASAFTGYGILLPFVQGIAYGSALLILAIIVSAFRLRVRRINRYKIMSHRSES